MIYAPPKFQELRGNFLCWPLDSQQPQVPVDKRLVLERQHKRNTNNCVFLIWNVNSISIVFMRGKRKFKKIFNSRRRTLAQRSSKQVLSVYFWFLFPDWKSLTGQSTLWQDACFKLSLKKKKKKTLLLTDLSL